MLHQDALHGNAGLPGIAKTAGHATFRGISEIAVVVHDDARIAAEFQHDLFLARFVLDRPADAGAAREANELDALVGHEQACIFVG